MVGAGWGMAWKGGGGREQRDRRSQMWHGAGMAGRGRAIARALKWSYPLNKKHSGGKAAETKWGRGGQGRGEGILGQWNAREAAGEGSEDVGLSGRGARHGMAVVRGRKEQVKRPQSR